MKEKNEKEEKIRNKFICFAAGKGGVGKSIVSSNIAYAASQLTSGKVIAISADPGSKTLEYLVEGGFKPEKGWVEYLNDVSVHITEVMIKSRLAENLYVVYSSTKKAFYSGSDASTATLQLTNIIHDWNSDPRISLVVVDTPAGRTRDHLVYASVFETYIVTTHSRVDLKAAEEFRNTLNKKMFELFKVEEEVIKGMVANMVASKKEVEEVRQYLDLPLLGMVPYSPAMEQANKEALPLVAYNPSDPASKAMYEMARKLLHLDISAEADVLKRAQKGRRGPTGRSILDSLKGKIQNMLG